MKFSRIFSVKIGIFCPILALFCIFSILRLKKYTFRADLTGPISGILLPRAKKLRNKKKFDKISFFTDIRWREFSIFGYFFKINDIFFQKKAIKRRKKMFDPKNGKIVKKHKCSNSKQFLRSNIHFFTFYGHLYKTLYGQKLPKTPFFGIFCFFSAQNISETVHLTKKVK